MGLTLRRGLLEERRLPPLVFLVGSPRSGTTLLQRLLGAHPEVATSQETDLYSSFVAEWFDLWDQQLPMTGEEWRNRRHKGLPAVLEREDFVGLIRDFTSSVYDVTLQAKPSAKLLLDKNPTNSLYIDVILELAPDARFIHIIRDGRDVARSLVRASESWGYWWAANSVRVASKTWADHVRGARLAKDRGAPYMEVRYEDLITDEPSALEQIFCFMNLEVDLPHCSAIHEQVVKRSRAGDPHDTIVWTGEVAKRLKGPPPEPSGFAAKRNSDGWQSDWSRKEKWQFHQQAGDLLIELGYARPDWIDLGALETLAYQAMTSRVAGLARAGGARVFSKTRKALFMGKS